MPLAEPHHVVCIELSRGIIRHLNDMMPVKGATWEETERPPFTGAILTRMLIRLRRLPEPRPESTLPVLLVPIPVAPLATAGTLRHVSRTTGTDNLGLARHDAEF